MKTYIKNNYWFMALMMSLFILGGCSEDDDNELGPEPTADFTISEESTLVDGNEISFINQSIGGVSFFWSFGDGETAIGQNVSHTFPGPGEYNVSLEVSANGKRDVVTKSVTIEAVQFELYFMNNDDSEMQKVNTNDPENITTVFTISGVGIGLEYDSENDDLYYSDDTNFAVYKNSINGGSETLIADGFDGPRDLAIDKGNNRIIVVEKFIHEVLAVDLTSGEKSTLFSSADDPDFLRPEGVDIYDNKLYMTAVEIDAETVWTANSDGSNLTRIIDYSAGGYGYALEIDKENEKIYFDDFDTNSILMSDLDGSNIEVVGSTTDQVYGIAINNILNKVYWASFDGVIKESNLDGSGERVLVDVGAEIRGLIVRRLN